MDEKERSKLKRKLRKLNGLCQHCGRLNQEKHGPTCTECRSSMRSYISKKRADNPHLCHNCFKLKDDPFKKNCSKCRLMQSYDKAIKRLSSFGNWIANVRTPSHEVANGTKDGRRRISSRYLPWTHQDFCNAFPGYKESGKQLDHIIPLACAETECGILDMEFGELATRLENIQLLTPSENVKKAANIERQIKARAIALRQQGKHGAELFHQLWAEFAYPQRQEEGNQDALPND